MSPSPRPHRSSVDCRQQRNLKIFFQLKIWTSSSMIHVYSGNILKKPVPYKARLLYLCLRKVLLLQTLHLVEY